LRSINGALTISGSSLAVFLTNDPNITVNGQLSQLRVDNAQRLMVNSAPLTSANDSVSAAQSGVWTVAATQSGTWTSLLAPSASATGLSLYSNTALSTTVAQVKGTSARSYDIHVDNGNAAMTYIQCFNVPAATTVTLGTTTPDLVLGIPGNGVLDKSMAYPYSFSNGLKIAATTTPTGSTAPGTALNVSLGYV
jgi:hypothetical protein